MTACELRITQLPARNVTLLQVDGTHDEKLASLVDRLLSPGNRESAIRDHGCPRAYELSATECLLVDFPRERLRRSLRDCGRVLLRLTDVSSAFALLRVAGSAAGRILTGELETRRGPAGGGPDWYGRARLGEAEVIVQRAGGDSFDLYVVRGLSPYLESWLRARWQARFPPVRSTVQ
ncbi:MAG TPA: hypothetical protein VHB68_04055 [Steroidobacteraceae bacterium]|nr:hypothetical protein [Planctomycetaceae bacterium]HVW68120.1 hypothetical protein [Steroidobacteraceae bacterium]